ncbi:MAG TPA: ATP-binding cassette domain-containing protein [Rhabdochlamydiaceae bacterium]|jgi:zinc transport system ATP-binding protein
MNEPIIELENVDFAYDSTPVLQSASLIIRQKEFVGLFGPNGGGKTTLLKLLLGFLTPTRGKVALLGQPPKKMRTCIGYVPQHLRFDRAFPISVLEVVLLGCLSQLSWHGTFPPAVKEKAAFALERVGLSHKLSSAFGSLSGGEAQRVLIARAIADEPELLLLDEPTASLDPHAQQLIYQLLGDLNSIMTIVMVSHDLQTILNKVQRFICVYRSVTAFENKELCEHFALGLYHTPLTSSNHFAF